MKNGWQAKKLGALCEIELGRTPARANNSYWDERRETGNVWLSIADLLKAEDNIVADSKEYVSDEGAAICKLVPKGTLLVSFKLTLGRLAFAGQDLFTNEAIAALSILNEHELSKEFLFYFLHFFDWTKAAENDVKLKGMTLNKAKLKEMTIHFPPPAEQRRIVGILDEAFEGITVAKANAEKNLKNARALFESFLNLAIQGRLIPQNSADSPAAELIKEIEQARNAAIKQGRAKPEKSRPAETKEDTQVELPNSWKWARLESLTGGISDGVHKTPQYSSNGIPFVTVKNLTAGPGISFDETNFITREDHEEFVKRTHPEKGDILITKDGTIGVVRLIETDIEFSIFVSVALIKPIMRELGPYLVYALRASCVQSQIVPQGAALKHLYLVDLRKLAIPLPPLAEQKRIVATLNSLNAEIQRLESICGRKLAALEALKKSLLHQAFTGQL